MGNYMDMTLNTETLKIMPDILSLVAELDEFSSKVRGEFRVPWRRSGCQPCDGWQQ